MTLAYVTIGKPEWFPLQTALLASEQILNFITSTYEGRTPPVQFLVSAWASTVHYFSEQIRMTERTANDVVGNIGAWEHKWKWSGPSAASAGAGTQAANREPDNRELQNQIHAMKGQVKRCQQEAEKGRPGTARGRPVNEGDEGSNRRGRGNDSAAAKKARKNANNGKGQNGKGGKRGSRQW